jgi:hypothetical protein
MPKKSAPDCSEFVKELLAHLYPMVRTMRVEFGEKQVVLKGNINGKLVPFANLRTARLRSADILLRGYMPEETSLPAEWKKLVKPEAEGHNGYFLKGIKHPFLTAQAVHAHFKDLKERISAYEKLHRVKRGEIAPRTWTRGIPAAYFEAELFS